MKIRPAREKDVEAAAELLNEHSRRLHDTDDVTPADLLLYWTSPDVELGRDILLAENSDGLVGYADLGVYGGSVWLDVRGTDPEALPALLEAIEERAAAKEPDKALWGYTSAEDAPLVDLYESWLHWMVEEPSFDRSLWFLAEQDGDLAGIILSRAPENEPGLGWIRILGVLPEYRQRGLGQALLKHAFAEFASRGFKAVGLGVDAENPTGAVRVYERAGMHVERTNLIFEKSER